jgi:hypothetical protein
VLFDLARVGLEDRVFGGYVCLRTVSGDAKDNVVVCGVLWWGAP